MKYMFFVSKTGQDGLIDKSTHTLTLGLSMWSALGSACVRKPGSAYRLSASFPRSSRFLPTSTEWSAIHKMKYSEKAVKPRWKKSPGTAHLVHVSVFLSRPITSF